MASDNRTPVVLCWHMHQPDYQDHSNGQFLFPWVYLHCIKDYVDMAAHLEAHPDARAVVNFAPVLLEQIETYLYHIERWRHGGQTIGDPLLAALVNPALPEPGSPAFLDLMEKCLRANAERIIKRFPAYARLAEVADLYRTRPDIQRYLSTQFLADLLVWYHLGWMAETVRRKHGVVRSLQEKAHQYTLDDRKALLDVIAELMASIGPRYRHLAQTGQVELAMSPWAHPIVPLLLDFGSAREAMPEIALPEHGHYPGGKERAIWHLAEGRRSFKRFFGTEPGGCWSSEGGLSQATLVLLGEQGFRWTASGDSVINNSINKARANKSLPEGATIHQPYRFNDTGVTAFFRDDGLSDLIGFTYADWHAKDAVGDLVHHMENIARAGKPVISVILDGENAWEYYPENGFHFLDELYRVLEKHPKLRLTTYSTLQDEHYTEPVHLPELVAGSWIYGTFSTWIGDPDKNRAWDLLCEAKQHFDRAMDNGSLSTDQKTAATHQLGLCEGSDWFWWFGDYNPASVVRDFEQLYRRHLANLYERIGYPAPSSLFQPLSQGGGEPAKGGAMRPGHEAGS
ncbi:glycoside hydrolase family 57 protein [Marinobacter sp. bablab_jr008]|jgi:alpha-amylase/alpha-mannosidase (GH57 family)|uniref:glycoside hydrolase family 57 protein n=1 Tax=Marinobacter sp. bablab_jr008 TaxID=2755064 RepID=UPI0018F1F696|nr:glycoside hydrolase family 57 protein [Marinobacter sp. bablab_jr008]MEC9386300.1 glycoside hydrolase family 57 protein [Pseudomonadota bacterium]